MIGLCRFLAILGTSSMPEIHRFIDLDHNFAQQNKLTLHLPPHWPVAHTRGSSKAGFAELIACRHKRAPDASAASAQVIMRFISQHLHRCAKQSSGSLTVSHGTVAASMMTPNSKPWFRCVAFGLKFGASFSRWFLVRQDKSLSLFLTGPDCLAICSSTSHKIAFQA